MARGDCLFCRCVPASPLSSCGRSTVYWEDGEPRTRADEGTGNHAQGVALAGHELGIACTIVMPLNTPSIKYLNVDRLGAKVVLHGADFDEAKIECARLAKLHGLTNIPPFDDPYVIAGQGTIAVEILRQTEAKDLDAIFVCVGGGGLLAGILTYMKAVAPGVRIIGVETHDADAFTKSFAAGERLTLSEVGLFADGTAVRQVGEETWRLCAALVDEMILVSNDEVCAAIKDVFGGALFSSICALLKRCRHSLRSRAVGCARRCGDEKVHPAEQPRGQEQALCCHGLGCEPQLQPSAVHLGTG